MILARVVLAVAVVWLGAATLAGAQARPVRVPTSAGEVTVIADRLEDLGGDQLVLATGHVEITRGSARLTADRVELNRETGDAVATGRVTFFDGDTQLTAERVDYNFRTGTGVVHRGRIRTPPYYRVDGERLERLEESVYRVQGGVFTTCEADPPDWSIRFGQATADVERYVYGTNASFWVRSVPLIPWVPFLAAPIRRERETGFLFPKVGYSSRRGAFAEVPFFWAISDSQDLTIAPIAYQLRGIGAHAEYRYVLSADHRGNTRGFVLNETERDGDTRGWGQLRHDWRLGRGLSVKADLRRISDDIVLEEYGDDLRERGEQRIESNLFATKNWDSWSLVGNLFAYQDLTTRRPVELNRLPDLSLTGVRQPVPGIPGLLWESEMGLVRFVREVGSEGTRLDLHPRLSRPFSAAGVTLTPFLGARATAYDRRVTGTHTGRGGQIIEETEQEFRLRRLVEVGGDLETIASRPYRTGGFMNLEAIQHSIEPRLNYTRIDGKDMDRLPSWTDIDRLEDTSRLEYSITNRIRGKTVSPPGTEPQRLEMVRLVLAHSLDLKARRQTSGDLVADLLFRTTERLAFRGDIRYGTHGEGIQAANTDVALTLPRITASVGTRYSDLANVSFFQALVRAELLQNVIGHLSSNWDLRTNTIVENRYGLDIRFQCWTISMEFIDRSSARGHRADDEFRVAVNLLGVGGPGSTRIGMGSITGGSR